MWCVFAVGSVSVPYRGYTYDVFGNLTQVASAGNIASYVDYAANTSTNRLQGEAYDTSGNLLSYQGSAYSWDALGNRTAVNTGTEQWVHTYDATGERLWSWRTAPTRLDNYALRGRDNKVLSAFTKSSSSYTWEDYIYREGQLLAAGYSDGRTAHFDVDHLGSVRQESDGSGVVIKYREFWPYGEEATAPSGTERMKFTGHERDLGDPSSTADDMDYMHARYYKPLTGRFLTPDPSKGDPRNIQSWNRFAYTRDNPLRYVDPDGQAPIDYIMGYVNGFSSDMVFGLFRADSKNSDYQTGQFRGDAAAQKVGAALTAAGSTTAGAGLTVEVPTAGTSTALVVAGVLTAGYGVVIGGISTSQMSRTPHGQGRADQARAGDTKRQVGDPNRVIREGQELTDSETGNRVFVSEIEWSLQIRMETKFLSSRILGPTRSQGSREENGFQSGSRPAHAL